MYLVVNPVHHNRIKHRSLDYHFIRERVKTNSLQVAFIASQDQKVDLLTKALPTARFLQMRSKLGLLPARIEGG